MANLLRKKLALKRKQRRKELKDDNKFSSILITLIETKS